MLTPAQRSWRCSRC